MISNAQPPPTHPAMQMRKYYADVYTGSSIVEFQSSSLDSILMVVSALVVKAQVISVYSYVDNPFKNRYIYGISKKTLEKSAMCASFPRSRFKPYRTGKTYSRQINYHWSPRQYHSDFSRGIPRRDSYWRPREHKS